MALVMNQQMYLNNFKRHYLHTAYRSDWNKINISKADSYNHNLVVSLLCLELLNNDIPFLTQARFKNGYRPDCVGFYNGQVRIFEVRHTETSDDSEAKKVRIPEELQDSIVYIDVEKIVYEKPIFQISLLTLKGYVL